MIRPAVPADIPRLVAMGQRFRAETGYSKHMSENLWQMEKTAAFLISSGGLLVSELRGELIGMIGFALYPHLLSGETVAGEVMWWVEPEYRGGGIKLLLEAERRARADGAKRMQMIAPCDEVARVYQRCGYEYVESAYQKTL